MSDTAMSDVALDEVDLSDLDDNSVSIPVRCAFLTGIAGSGKTYQVRELVAKNPSEGILCATTGIAAVNLGTITINSLLKYFDTDSLVNAFISGKLTTRLAAIAKQYRNIYVDEVSMMAAEQLDVMYQAVREANKQVGVRKVRPEGLGIVIVGDLCQLPPIKAKWIFEAECWSEFDVNTTRLTHNWRQAEGEFLRGINLLRAGEGGEAAAALTSTGVQFTNTLDLAFNGTTIMSKNDEVDRYNWTILHRLSAPSFTVNSKRWITEGFNAPSEWKLIPPALELKVGAYVMILANAPASDFSYANGDCGWVVEKPKTSGAIKVRLARNDTVVEVTAINRHRTESDYDGTVDEDATTLPRWGIPYFDKLSEKFVLGTVRYLPIRLAYASTVHKSQGLTLDRVQLDIRNAFFGNPAMAYVALSRCRTAEGLRIVGTEKLLAQRCAIDPKVRPWV